VRIERISFKTASHGEHCPAHPCGASHCCEKAKRFPISPMHVFDRDKKWPIVCRRRYERGYHTLLPVRPRRCVHGLIDFSRGFGLRHLEEVTRIERVIHLQRSVSHKRVNRAFGHVRCRFRAKPQKSGNNSAYGTMTSRSAEIEDETSSARHAGRCGD